MKLPHVCDLKKNKRHIIFNSAINICCWSWSVYVPLSKVGQTIAERRSSAALKKGEALLGILAAKLPFGNFEQK